MAFRSILEPDGGVPEGQGMFLWPACAGDIQYDRIVDDLTAGFQDYDLKGIFLAPRRDPDLVRYRQEVARDLRRPDLNPAIRAFSARMALLRRQLLQVEKLYCQQQKERWFLEAAATYCQAVEALLEALGSHRPESRGLRGFRNYLAGYVAGVAFSGLAREARRIRQELAAVQYTVAIQGGTFRVDRFAQEPDYGREVARFFEKFEQGGGTDWHARFREGPVMNHVEEQILQFVSRLFPGPFAELTDFCARHAEFQDATLKTFDREVQFYLAYLDFIAPLEEAGLAFCFPEVTRDSKDTHARGFFDLALAGKLVPAKVPVVANDFRLEGRERALVVTGPNQGGKTTFARAFAQLHLLAALGLPVPGREARLFLFDGIYTHFQQAEAAGNLRGQLQDELVRMHGILDRAGSASLIVINEIFASTTWQDATAMGKRVLARILDLDAVCICVTFLDELAAQDGRIVSMVSTVAPDDDRVRTFRIVRAPANGLAYALSLARRFRLTRDQLLERL